MIHCSLDFIFSKRTVAGSSLGFWGTNLPWIASCRIDFLISSGKLLFKFSNSSSILPYFLTKRSDSFSFATILDCSSKGNPFSNVSSEKSDFSH